MTPFARTPIARAAALLVAVAALSLVVVASALAGARSHAVTRAVLSGSMLSGPLSADAGRAAKAGSGPKVPRGFAGVNLDGPLAGGALSGPVTPGTGSTGQPSLPGAMTTMVSSGVQSVRAAFNWAAAQPAADGPYDFSQSDLIVADAARSGLTVLPVVLYTPNWDAVLNPSGIAIPDKVGPYAAYLTALVKRYGPNGTFWSANPSLPRRPIRQWQIWNEPNFTYFWPTRPFAPSYVALLKAAHAAVHRADPGAKVVLAGMPNHAWKYLQQIYRVKGAGKAFDIASVHPYTVVPANVILFIQKMRQVMARNGNAGKPLIVTEMGWNNSIGHRPADTDCCQSTTARQAQKVKQILPLLAKDRRALKLQAFYYYTWASHGVVGGPSDDWAGIFQIQGSKLIAKPVFRSFKAAVLAMEHCRRVGKLAGSCVAR